MEKNISKLLPANIAAAYIKEVLITGGAMSFDVDSEPVFAIAPENASNARVLDFAQGGLLTAMPRTSDGHTSVQAVPTTVPTAATIVCDELMQCQQPAFWIHEPLLTEAEIAQRNMPHVIIDRQIYLVFESELDAGRIAELIRYSLLSWHFLAFVTEGRSQIRCVDDLVRSARLILVGAYDGESFLYKRRPGLNADTDNSKSTGH